jgi:hypothetical protein
MLTANFRLFWPYVHRVARMNLVPFLYKLLKFSIAVIRNAAQVRLEDFEGALGSYTKAANLAPGISGQFTSPTSPTCIYIFRGVYILSITVWQAYQH